MSISVANYCIQFLISKGIRVIPGIPGGTILPIYDALAGSRLHHILARHEQGAGFIAQGMARSTGKVSACLVSSGPGVANLLTAVSDAYSDSVPMLILSGQVPRSLLGTDAFQELPTKSIVSHFTKASYLVMNPNDIPRVLEEAYKLAGSGRPGPVWIDLPKDVQNEMIADEYFLPLDGMYQEMHSDDFHSRDTSLQLVLDETKRFLRQATKPLFYIGGGAKNAGEILRKVISSLNVPVVSTLMGLGLFKKEDPLFLGMMGMHGTVSANLALGDCDLLIALGVRFDDRATGSIQTFCPNAKIIHIDIDAKEIDKNKLTHAHWQGDLQIYLENLIPFLPELRKENLWAEKVRIKSEVTHQTKDGLIVDLFYKLGESFSAKDFILTDVGQHQMWTAQHFAFPSARSWITSGGQGTMGFGLPAAIGVSIANPESNVLCITGDGSIMMNLQELATLRELNANVKIIILNNKHLGLVRQQQELFYGNRKSGSVFEFQPDFMLLAKSFGVRGEKFILGDEFDGIAALLAVPGPCLIEILISEEESVYPFVPGGKSNQEFILDNKSLLEV
jgi:acetolactate synthase-1/2/3 large subunit